MRYIWLIVAILFVGACASDKPKQLGGPEGVKAFAGSEMPAPERIDLKAVDRPFLIGPYDKLLISVFGIEELSEREVQTDASGRISFPLAGVIEAAGKTPDEIGAILEARLKARYIRNPQVTVNLKETVSQLVTVDGQVKEPGAYPVIGNMTLMRAIATAKGTSEDAKLEEVIIFRTVSGQKMAALYDLKAIRSGIYNDPSVYANDIVVVGDSPQRRRLREALQFLPALATPIVVLLQNL